MAKKPPKKPPSKDYQWAVYAGFSMAIVIAPGKEAARKQMLMDMKLETKPWLGRDWEIHRASAEEIRRYAAFADALPKSRPTARVAKNPRASVRDRLL
jgi:hypothetical protein